MVQHTGDIHNTSWKKALRNECFNENVHAFTLNISNCKLSTLEKFQKNFLMLCANGKSQNFITFYYLGWALVGLN